MNEKKIKILAKKFDLERKRSGGEKTQYSAPLKREALDILSQGVKGDDLSRSLKVHKVTFNKWKRNQISLGVTGNGSGKGLDNPFTEIHVNQGFKTPSDVVCLETPRGLKIKTENIALLADLIRGLEGWS